MFTLISGCIHWLTEKEQLNILIVGLQHSGKTSVLEQQKRRLIRGYRGPSLDALQTTMGMNLGKLPLHGKVVSCWDVAGSMPSVWSRYYSDADGVMFVVDAADVGAFDRASRALDSLLHMDADVSVPVLILANKTDVLGAASTAAIQHEVVRTTALAQSQRRYAVMRCSAKRDEGLSEAFDWLMEAIKAHAQATEPQDASGSQRWGIC